MPDHATTPSDIALVVDHDDEKNLTKLQNMLLSDPVVKDLGLPVSKAAAAKKAFRRGLEVLLKEGVRGEETAVRAAEELDKRLTSVELWSRDVADTMGSFGERIKALEAGTGSRPLPGKPTKPSGAEPPQPPEWDVGPDGLIPFPQGLDRWSPNEQLPAGEEAIHEYYTGLGWTRVWGMNGGARLSFYWSNDPNGQDVELYRGPGPEVVIQVTPFGKCHLIKPQVVQVEGKAQLAGDGRATVMS